MPTSGMHHSLAMLAKSPGMQTARGLAHTYVPGLGSSARPVPPASVKHVPHWTVLILC